MGKFCGLPPPESQTARQIRRGTSSTAPPQGPFPLRTQMQRQPRADSCLSITVERRLMGRMQGTHNVWSKTLTLPALLSQKVLLSDCTDNFYFLKKRKAYKSAPYQDFILPNHPPEVDDSSGERTLGCNVCSWPIDTLKQHSNQTRRHSCIGH